MTSDHHLRSQFSEEEWRFLREAAAYLEDPSLLTRIANLVGKPIESLLAALPQSAQKLISESTSDALQQGLKWAIRSLPENQREAKSLASEKLDAEALAFEEAPDEDAEARSERSRTETARRLWQKHRHTAMAALSGAGGGLFGLPGLVVELPTTTVLMLRSIASVAAEMGADLDDPATRLECVAVLSYGSRPLEDMELSYFSTRLAAASAVRQASQFVAGRTSQQVAEALASGSAPAILRFINAVASRFQIAVSQKAAAQAVPLVGAGLGAMVNAAFTDHFNRVARFHFGIVDLERRRGRDLVERAYRQVRSEVTAPRLAVDPDRA